jgi:hypothetical protein
MPRPLRFGGLKGVFSALGKAFERRGIAAGMHFVALSISSAADSSVPFMAAFPFPKSAYVPYFFSIIHKLTNVLLRRIERNHRHAYRDRHVAE